MSAEEKDLESKNATNEKVKEVNYSEESEDDASSDNEAYIEKLKKEAIKWRTKAKENKEATAKLEESDRRLKEAESNAAKAMKEIESMRSIADSRIINAELRALAGELGLKKMEYIKLADISKLTINDNGEVVGARELMQSLKSSDPDLFRMATSTNVHFQPGQKSEAPPPGEKPMLKLSKKEYEQKERDMLRTFR